MTDLDAIAELRKLTDLLECGEILALGIVSIHKNNSVHCSSFAETNPFGLLGAVELLRKHVLDQMPLKS